MGKGTHKMSLEQARNYLPRNPNRKIQSLEDKVKCLYCDKYYTTKQSLRFHMKNIHPELYNGQSFEYESGRGGKDSSNDNLAQTSNNRHNNLSGCSTNNNKFVGSNYSDDENQDYYQ